MFFFDEVNEQIAFNPRSIEHAYLALLSDDLLSAQAVFESLDSPRARWGRALVGILSGFLEYFPTYFEIRNFLEIDLDFMIKNEKFNYTENILSSLEILSKTNREVYKYTARVLYENKLYKTALEYMEKSKELYYNDPELHFMLAKYYFHTNQFKTAKHYIDECLKMIPMYYPAMKMKEQITYKL